MIKGFEKDVGTKTSFYGFTVNTMKNSLISYWNFGFTSVPQGQVRLPMGLPLSRTVSASVPRAPSVWRTKWPQSSRQRACAGMLGAWDGATEKVSCLQAPLNS